MIINTFFKRYSFCSITKRIKYDIKVLHWLGSGDNKISRFLTKVFYHKMIKTYGAEIHPGASIDETVRFFHVIGIVIGENAVIKENVSIYQSVTIGANFGLKENRGTSMPLIGKNTIIYSGAVVVGGITIGANSVIAANSIVTKSIPPYSLVTGFNVIKNLKEYI